MNTRSLDTGSVDLLGPLVEHLKKRGTAVLLGMGILVVVLHASFRFPLRLPGHHGLEWMALLVLARQMSSYRWAASVAASGAAAASMFPVFGFHAPLVPLIYLVPGVVMDLLCRVLPAAQRQSAIALGLVAALAFATKPLIQLAGGLALGLPFDSWSNGLAYLMGMHMMFAFAGGAIGAYAWRRVSQR